MRFFHFAAVIVASIVSVEAINMNQLDANTFENNYLSQINVEG